MKMAKHRVKGRDKEDKGRDEKEEGSEQDTKRK